MTDTPMTKGEREDLQRLIRQREKVQKSAAKRRSAEMLADFENQMGSVYQPEDDPIWKEAEAEAEKVVAKAEATIQARCAELGIVKDFAPSLRLAWAHRGYTNMLASRRAELRIMARTRIEALEQAAIVEIELDSVNAQTELAANGLTSEAARSFLAKLKPVDELMPKLSFEEIAGRVDPPIAAQLIAPNVLRQRRYRERLAKRNGDAAVTSQPTDASADKGGAP